MRSSRWVGVAATLALGLGWACASNDSPTVGGETHWLGACATDADCGRGTCLCNVCTQVCERDADCNAKAGAKAQCFDVASPGLASRCAAGASGSAPGVCLAVCVTNGDCPNGDSCLLGACVVSTDSKRDAGTSKDAGTHDASFNPKPSDYANYDANVSFDHPVQLPPPSTTIVGAPASLVGHWAAMNDDGSVCTSNNPSSNYTGISGVCAQLVIEDSPTGPGLTGYVYWFELPPPAHFASDASFPLIGPVAPSPPPVVGPFASVANPDVGYPTEVRPDRYADLRSITPGVHYRLLDAAFAGTELSFTFSTLDLWSDWCARQNPYAVGVKGEDVFRCVPGTATSTNTDLGKLALCRPAEDGPNCKADDGLVGPCSCIVDGQFNGGAPLCSSGTCACTAAGCTADLRNGAASATFRLSGDTLTGSIAVYEAIQGFPSSQTLKRTGP